MFTPCQWRLLPLMLLALASLASLGQAQSLTETGRKLAEEIGPALVTVQIVVTIGDDTSGEELKSE